MTWVRASRIPILLDQLLQDARYALRTIRRSPGFSAVVILTLAIAIGMNTAVFTVVDAVLLRPLSFPHPERVLWLTTVDARSRDELVAAHDVIAWREAASLDRLVAYDEFDGQVTATGAAIPARIATVSDDFWDLAGAAPAVGRLPAAGQSEVLLSHAFFVRAFGANPAVVGTAVRVGGRMATVAGVLPPGFRVDLAPPPSFAGLAPREIDAYHAIMVRPPQAGMIQLYRVVGRVR